MGRNQLAQIDLHQIRARHNWKNTNSVDPGPAKMNFLPHNYCPLGSFFARVLGSEREVRLLPRATVLTPAHAHTIENVRRDGEKRQAFHDDLAGLVNSFLSGECPPVGCRSPSLSFFPQALILCPQWCLSLGIRARAVTGNIFVAAPLAPEYQFCAVEVRKS